MAPFTVNNTDANYAVGTLPSHGSMPGLVSGTGQAGVFGVGLISTHIATQALRTAAATDHLPEPAAMFPGRSRLQLHLAGPLHRVDGGGLSIATWLFGRKYFKGQG
jgi:hypothetical protein